MHREEKGAITSSLPMRRCSQDRASVASFWEACGTEEDILLPRHRLPCGMYVSCMSPYRRQYRRRLHHCPFLLLHTRNISYQSLPCFGIRRLPSTGTSSVGNPSGLLMHSSCIFLQAQRQPLC